MTQTLPTPGSHTADRTTGHVLLRNISWKTYTTLLGELGDGGTRLTYDRGLLEIEVPSRHHEMVKRFVGEIAEAAMRHAGLEYEPSGSATWRRVDALRGLEADECYHVQHAGAVRGRTELDLDVDPPPDLAIEVDLTSDSMDKLPIYATLGIPEVWRVRINGGCDILRLATDRPEYEPADASAVVRAMTRTLLDRYVKLREEVGHSEAVKRFSAEVLGR